MYLSQQPFQWSAQFGPSLTNSYDKQFDRGIKNPEGMYIMQSIQNLVIFSFQENLV